MRRTGFVLFALVALLAVTFVPALAVTDGTPDGNGHPAVVLILMEVAGKPAFRCSGTLLSPTVVLTAGHCTNNFPGSPYTGMRVFTESDVEAGRNTPTHPNPNPTNSYPTCDIGRGITCFEADSWASHSLYETAPFFVHDVGVIILKAPGVVLSAGQYGTLPGVDQLDSLKTRRGLKDTSFTSVGYGLQASFPDAASWKDVAFRTRYVAYPRLIQINVPGFTGDFSMLLSNNANTGGTCFGDSGGPNFLGNTNIVAGVTSFGKNGNCAGTGGVFRMDRQDVLDFIHTYLP